MRSAGKATFSDQASDGGMMMVITVLLAALIPAGCVLWFMNAAMENQQLAVRQSLTDVYRSQFDARKTAFKAFWEDFHGKLERASSLQDLGRAYDLLVSSGACSAVVVYDDSGRVLYPRQLKPAPIDTKDSVELWDKARGLEEDQDYRQAGELYERLSRQCENVHLSARAIRSQVRCLLRSGRTSAAVEIIAEKFSDPKYRNSLDAEGRMIAPAGQLLALQIGGDELTPELSMRLTRDLVQRLWDENDPMPASQRMFLIASLRKLRPDAASGRSDSEAAMRAYTLDQSQSIAAEYLDTAVRTDSRTLAPTQAAGLWAVSSSDRRVTALFTDSQLNVILRDISQALPKIHAAEIAVRYRPSPQSESGAFISAPVGPGMPEWRMSLVLKGPDPFHAAAEKQRLTYMIVAGVAIGLISLMALAVAKYIGRQMTLTRLKNDLIATVSHELKTPLASMRVLIDTLVDRRLNDRIQADEYLRLIARENLRLSRLIDNFLTFSRMERNKYAFEPERLQVVDLVEEAIESASDRFGGPDSCLEVEIAPDLPPIAGDRDSLVTVILNLLDNAWKYSADDRAIRIEASSGGGFVRLEVIDNGVGMPRRIARRIFARFYQADRTLTSSGGCGLGLSIVKFILDAHRATIEVASRPGQGSTFIVKIPALPDNGDDA